MKIPKDIISDIKALEDDREFATAHLEIFHCTHHPVIPKSDLYWAIPENIQKSPMDDIGNPAEENA